MSEQIITDNNLNNSEIALEKKTISIGLNCKLGLVDAYLVGHKKCPVQLDPSSYEVMEKSHHFLKVCIDQRIPIYGINTHFGDQVNLLDSNLKNTDEAAYYESINARQINLIRSHSCGLGEAIPAEIVRAAMMLRAHCLSQGYSGVTHFSVEAILNVLNAGIVPKVCCYGSIGASGDLIPLSMIAAGITGQDVDVFYDNQTMRAPDALQKAGLEKFTPHYRDGLAMINGTSFMTAIASLAIYDLKRLYQQMLYAIAMSLESMMVISSGYHPLVHQLKRQAGESTVNHFLLNFWEGSHLLTDLDELRDANISEDTKRPLQDYYSLRAVSQGFGPLQENLERAITWIENEMNSINDNPIIDLEEMKIHHSANFMGYYVTDACDILKMDIAQASTWLHALLANMVHPRKSHDLPANLVDDPGHQNGFRPIQLLTAALAVQNRKLAESHQAYTLPTEGDNQDVNSLGTHAALDLRESVANLERLTAIMLLASTQALEFRGVHNASLKAQQICQKIREFSKKITDCRPMSEEINRVVELLKKEII